MATVGQEKTPELSLIRGDKEDPPSADIVELNEQMRAKAQFMRVLDTLGIKRRDVITSELIIIALSRLSDLGECAMGF